MPHPPEKIWRCSHQGPLIGQWLMSNDFQAIVATGSVSVPRASRTGTA